LAAAPARKREIGTGATRAPRFDVVGVTRLFTGVAFGQPRQVPPVRASPSPLHNLGNGRSAVTTRPTSRSQRRAPATGHGQPPWRVLARLGSVYVAPTDGCDRVLWGGLWAIQAALGAPPIGCRRRGGGPPQRGVEGGPRRPVQRGSVAEVDHPTGQPPHRNMKEQLWIERAGEGRGCLVGAWQAQCTVLLPHPRKN